MSDTYQFSLIAGMACHISSKNDLKKLQIAIVSIQNQHIQPHLVCVSWSAQVDVKDETMLYIDQLPKDGWEFLFQDVRCQQFEHYNHIAQHVCDSYSVDKHKNTWILFGDADDEWHEARTWFMAKSLNLSLSSSVFVFPWNLVTSEDGALVRETTTDKEMFEYWMTMVRLDVFAKFFATADHRYLRSPYCDLAFDEFLLKNAPEEITYVNNDIGSENWLYHKKEGGSWRAGEGTSCRQIICKFLEMSLMGCYPDPLLRIVDWESLQSGIPLFALAKPVTMDVIWAAQTNTDYGSVCSGIQSYIVPACCYRKCSSHGFMGPFQLMRCGGCKLFKYCDKKCLRADYKSAHNPHKDPCNAQAAILAGNPEIKCKLHFLDIFSPDYQPDRRYW